jgi:hypothetical protein
MWPPFLRCCPVLILFGFRCWQLNVLVYYTNNGVKCYITVKNFSLYEITSGDFVLLT